LIGLEESYHEVVLSFGRVGLALPSNARKRHELDYLIAEYDSGKFVMTGGEAFQTVRGCFPEGAPLYKGSKILREAHIQVAVRDRRVILDLAVVH
jgi:hypothetical protein